MKQDTFVKVCFLGEETTGKDELREKNWLGLQPKWTDTMGSDFVNCQVEVQGRLNKYQLSVQLWDVASHDRFEAVRDLYYHGSNAAIIIFDVNEPETFLNTAKWIREFWTYNGRGTRPVVLVGNRVQFRKGKKALSEDTKIEFVSEKFETSHKDRKTNKKISFCVPSWNKRPEYIPKSWASDYAAKITEISGFDAPYIEMDTTEADLRHMDELLYIIGSLCLPIVVPEERLETIPAPKGDLFSKSRVRKLLLAAGAVRVSKGAVTALNLVLEKKGLAIASQAVNFARAAKRKTVTEKDISKVSRGW
ncbi:MAG: histone [Candidatus Odinarchaeota archaeon]